MPSQVQLLQLPDDGMRKILEKCDLESILTLRKTCHTLRTFIDDTKPDVKITTIDIEFTNDIIKLKIGQKSDKNYYQLDYIQGYFVTNQCTVIRKCGKPQKKRGQLNYTDFLDTFFQDLWIILNFQRKPLERLTINTTESGDIWFADQFGKFLSFCKKPLLKVERIFFNTTTQQEILEILPFIDSGALQKIHILYEKKGDLSEEIMNLEQWKNANTLDISDFKVKYLEHCTHFSTIMVHCSTIEVANVAIVKEIFFQSPNLMSIEINYNYISNEIYQQMGPHFYWESDEDNRDRLRWFYKTSNPQKIASMEVNQWRIKIVKVDRDIVPRNAIIL